MDVLKEVRKDRFDPAKLLNNYQLVVFMLGLSLSRVLCCRSSLSRERAIDTGGPTMKFRRLLVREVHQVHCAFFLKDVPAFEVWILGSIEKEQIVFLQF